MGQATDSPTVCLTCGHEWPTDPVYQVACPSCGAGVGAFCRRPSGHSGPFVTFHKERDLLALATGKYTHTDPTTGQVCGTTEREAYMLCIQHGVSWDQFIAPQVRRREGE